MEIKFITDQKVKSEKKKIELYLAHLPGKIQSIVDNSYLLESYKIK